MIIEVLSEVTISVMLQFNAIFRLQLRVRMELLVAPVEHITFDFEVALSQQLSQGWTRAGRPCASST